METSEESEVPADEGRGAHAGNGFGYHGRSIRAKLGVGRNQLTCLGSDQAESPVRTSILCRSLLTT